MKKIFIVLGYFQILLTFPSFSLGLPVRGVATRDIDVRRAGRLQRKTDEFAAALDAGPIVELVRHGVGE